MLLLLGGEGDDVGDDDVAVERGGEAGVVRPGHLLGHDDGVEEIRPQAAVLLGHAHREEALLPHLLPGLPGDDPRLLPLLDVGGDLLGEEPPQRIPEHPVFIRVLQNFHVISLLLSCSYRPTMEIAQTFWCGKPPRLCVSP